MFQELLAWMPKAGGAGGGAIGLSCAGVVLGFALWVAGARFSRMLMALLGVTIGGMIGMWIPRWMAWDVNTMATSLSLAMCFGVMGFAKPRVWVGVGLMIVLSVWAAVATWILRNENATLVFPVGSETLRDFWAALWRALPPSVKGMLPLAVGMASLAGLALVVMWRRIATVFFYSLLGVSMMLGMGLWAVSMRGGEKGGWPRYLPEHTQMQIVLILGMVVLGAMVQWLSLPMKKKVVARREGRCEITAGAEA